MSQFFVYNSDSEEVGKCYYTHKRGRISSVFSYAPSYLAEIESYNVDPEFSLIEGSQFSTASIPRAFADSAPDRWGRNLILKRHLYESAQAGISACELSDVDYLLGVSDISRQGNLRYKIEQGGEYSHVSENIPKLISLPKLLNSTKALSSEGSHEAIKYLLDAGSASLGGARPKATVCDGGNLFIAKFPHDQDEWDVISWEYVALSIAKMASIETPEFDLIDIEGDKVLLLKRFDRITASDGEEANNSRIGYISAMTLLGLSDGEAADYSDICLAMGEVCVDYKKDLHELYRRIVLSILINNTDDHLRNHGFLRVKSGWKLSPVFDINPNPNLGEGRSTSVFGASSRDDALQALIEHSDDFMLSDEEATAILNDVEIAVSSWRGLAKKIGISKRDIDVLENAFVK